MPAVINVGLNIGDREALSPVTVIKALRALGVTPKALAVHPSDTERTAVVTLAEPMLEGELDWLAATLDQDAVAQWDGRRGLLAGPMADAWGPFDPAFFVKPDGQRLGETQLNRRAA